MLIVKVDELIDEIGKLNAEIELDFGKHNLTLTDEEKLKVSLKGMGFSKPLREG